MRQLKNLLREIERKDMPQVKGKDTPELLKTLADNGIAYRRGKVAVDQLKPTQENGIPSKVDAIAFTIERGEPLHPIVISREGWILDGHHRWLAVKKVSGNGAKIEVICIMLPKWNALRMFDKVADAVA
jgi:uncharacterized protein (DUF1015 family)